MNEYIDISPEVEQAIKNNRPIVAIETGGTFEGIPFPDNEATALQVMETVRSAGSVPAYVSIIGGRIKFGMTPEEIHEYAQKRGTMKKASKREIPQIIAMKKDGVMTLAATMLVANLLGVSVVSGGGLGQRG